MPQNNSPAQSTDTASYCSRKTLMRYCESCFSSYLTPKSSTTNVNWMGLERCFHSPGLCCVCEKPCFANHFANISFSSRPACTNPYMPFLFEDKHIRHAQINSPCIILGFHLGWVWWGCACTLDPSLVCWDRSFSHLPSWILNLTRKSHCWVITLRMSTLLLWLSPNLDNIICHPRL